MGFGWLFSLLTGLPGFLNKGLDYLAKKADVDLEKYRVGTVAGKDVSIELIKGEIARQNAVRDVTVASMNHPIYWVAWAMFVLPVALYHGSIFWVSVFPGLGWTILKVPPDQIEFAKTIVLSMFGLHATSSILTGVLQRWGKP